LSEPWIVVCLIAIAALYLLLFTTARALHIAEQDGECATAAQAERQGHLVDPGRTATGNGPADA
jgi:hypothetical protein